MNKIFKKKLNKRLFQVSTGNTSLVCTEDHNLIVSRNGIKKNITPEEMQTGDLAITLSR